MFTSIRFPALCALLFAATIAAAEGAAILLAWRPSSPALWFLNLELFRPLHPGLLALEGAVGGAVKLFWAASAACMLAALAILADIRLLAAALSNMGLAVCTILASRGSGAFLTSHGGAEWATRFLDPRHGQGFTIILMLLAVTIAGAAAAHIEYMRAIWRRQ